MSSYMRIGERKVNEGKTAQIQKQVVVQFDNGYSALVTWGDDIPSSAKRRQETGVSADKYNSTHTVTVYILNDHGNVDGTLLPQYGWQINYCNMDKLIDVLYELSMLSNRETNIWN